MAVLTGGESLEAFVTTEKQSSQHGVSFTTQPAFSNHFFR